MRHVTWLLVCATAMPAAHAVEVADYRFDDSLSSSIPGAPTLVEIAPGGGQFIDTAVDGQAQRGWAFPDRAGFELPIDGLVLERQFSVALLLQTGDTSGYNKLVDVSGRTSDAGLYYSIGALAFYPDAVDAGASVLPNVYHQVVLTRSMDGEMVGYVDGVEQFRYVDTPANGAVLGGRFVFLRDDLVTEGEDPTGVIARLRVFDHVLTPDEVRALRQDPRLFRDGFEAPPR